MPAVRIIFGAAFTVGVSLALGTLLLRRLRLTFHRLEYGLFAFLAGSAVLSLATFFLCLIHQARAEVFLALGGVVMAWGWWAAGREPSRPALPPLPRSWQLVFTVIVALFFVCYLINALAPEVSPDGSGYHLGNVARLWRHRGFAWDYHSLYASMPQGLEMLFLVAFSFGRHSAAAMVHLAFQTTLPLLLVCYGRRFGFPRVGAFAGVVTYACPVIGIDGTSAYNDLAVATLIYAVFYLLQVYIDINSIKLLFLSGLCVGFACAVKYSAVLILPLAAGFVSQCKQPGRQRARGLATLAIGTAILLFPWLMRNLFWVGNPVAPFLNRWFPNPYWTAAAEREYVSSLGRYPPFNSYWNLFVQLTVKGGLVPGLLGPLVLLSPLSLLALRSREGRQLLLAGLIVGLPAWWNTEVRFLIPAVPFIALALGLAMSNSWGVLPALALFHCLTCWPSVLDTYCDRNAWRLRGLPVRAALRIVPEHVYIAGLIENYALKDQIEREVRPEEKIFSFAGQPAGYLERDILVSYESSEGLQIQQMLEKSLEKRQDRQALAREARSRGVDYILAPEQDPVGQDMWQNTKLWGMTDLAQAHGTHLYRID